MVLKNSREPICWKWWSFDHHEYWTVDEKTDLIPLLLRLKQDEFDGRWITEHVACTEQPEQINEFNVPIHTVLRIDKLFGSNFAKAHKDHYDNKKNKSEKMNMNKNEELKMLAKGAKGLVDTILEGLDNHVFDDFGTDGDDLKQIRNIIAMSYDHYTSTIDETVDDQGKKAYAYVDVLFEAVSKNEVFTHFPIVKSNVGHWECDLGQDYSLDVTPFWEDCDGITCYLDNPDDEPIELFEEDFDFTFDLEKDVKRYLEIFERAELKARRLISAKKSERIQPCT